jgi:hypothetical protein
MSRRRKKDRLPADSKRSQDAARKQPPPPPRPPVRTRPSVPAPSRRGR